MITPNLDAELLIAAQQGDATAVDRLVERWLPDVLGWCKRLAGPGVDPEDTAQEVAVLFVTRLHRIRDPHRLTSWLYGTTRRVIANHRTYAWIKRWMPGARIERPLSERKEVQRSPEDHAASSQLAMTLERALKTLPTFQREIVVLVDIEERTQAEAAALLEIPIGTAKSRLRAARASLKRELGTTTPVLVFHARGG